jgi:acetylornithine deacetylase/succinyl-diaminopimelate desuccinylase-like protein
MTTDVHAYIDAHLDNVLRDYQELLRIPSISALRAHDADSDRAAATVARILGECGLEHVEVIPTAGRSLVYGDWLHAEGKPTVLIYAHYDVQPVDPVEQWETPPFEPEIRGDTIYARGATDDKNQLTATIHAAGAFLDTRQALPVNVRFLFEGEEESGGDAIEAFVREHPERLASDVVVLADGGMSSSGNPVVYYGCRGILYTEIIARGARRDLHSGSFGGNAPNPLFALAQIITGLKDAYGHITIPGLEELATPIGDDELRQWEPQTVEFVNTLKSEMGLDDLVGEPEYTPLQRGWGRATLEVHGFIGGFQGEGSKTVIPADGRVKVSLRLVPGQTPENVLPLLRQRVAELTPPDIVAEVRLINGGLPFLTAVDSPAFQATCQALQEEFGVETWISRGGGSVPIAATFQEVLGGATFLVGFGLTGDWAHSPNEHTSLPTFYKSVHAFARILDALGAMKS